MIRLSLVTVVEKPDVANVEDLVLAFTEESREVLCGFCDLGQPDHSWEVDLTTLHEVSLQFDGVGAAGNGGLGKVSCGKASHSVPRPVRGLVLKRTRLHHCFRKHY